MPILELPCGLQTGAGKIERSLEVKKFSGKVQRDATSPDVKRNPVLLYDIALPDVILKVGLLNPTSRTVKEMLQADRDWLMFQIRRLTFGNKIVGRYECDVCKKAKRDKYEMETDFLIDEIVVKGLTDEDTKWWNGEGLVALDTVTETPDQIKTMKTRAFETLSKSGIKATFRYPSGIDQRILGESATQGGKVQSEDDINEGALVQELMARTLLQIGDKKAPKEGFTVEVWDTVDLDVVVELQAAFLKNQVGVETAKTVECDRGHAKTVRLQATDFLSR